MARLHPLLAALSLAATIAVAVSAPASAQAPTSSNSLDITSSTTIGTTITFYGTAFTNGAFSNGIFLAPLANTPTFIAQYNALLGFSPTFKNLVGVSSPYTGWLATFTLPQGTPGVYLGLLGFDSTVVFNGQTIPNGGASAIIAVSDVPEPGVVAFGMIAAGSVLGLAARRKKA